METIVFNRNHIKVSPEPIKTDRRWSVCWGNNCSETIYPKGMTMTTIRRKFEPVIKESPLGFYYKSNEEVEYQEESKVGVRVEYHTISIYLYENVYTIKYPISCNDVKIGFDARPWDICIGDMSMPEHFVKALQKTLDEIFSYAGPIKHWERTRDKIYNEVFGNTKGYNTLPNDIKIVSHGFDPKESFRKRKKVSIKKRKKCNTQKDTE